MSADIKIGVTVRNMGTQATAQTMLGCVAAAEAHGMESVWITDHIAIPPDDAEGSGGCYTDPLTTLAWLGGATSRVLLGCGVLILPYRPMLPTAKQIATVQELSGERLLLGVGAGWMDAEFSALGVERRQRGRITDATLSFINECFARDEMVLNGQAFLFKPRPAKPPILVGGSSSAALLRAARYGDGWLPMVNNPEKLNGRLNEYRHLTDELNKPPGSVSVLCTLPLDDSEQARRTLDRFRDLGVERVICALRYDSLTDYRVHLDKIMSLI